MKQFLFSIVIALQSMALLAQYCNPDMDATTPTQDFTDNGDGTVTHLRTGLTWMRCSIGQTWESTGNTCAGTASTHFWADAMAQANGLTFSGQSDWRVPNIKELASIGEKSCWEPAINKTLFPATAPNSFYWSASPNAGTSTFIWMHSLAYSDIFVTWKDVSGNVRLIRVQ